MISAIPLLRFLGVRRLYSVIDNRLLTIREKHVDPSHDESEEEQISVSRLGVSFDICKSLLSNLDPQYREQYFPMDTTSQTKLRTKEKEKVVLSVISIGATRDCIEERARRRDVQETADCGVRSKPEADSDSRPFGNMNSFVKVVSEFLEIANDDESFTFLCLLFNNDIGDRFKTIVGTFLERFPSDDLGVCNVMHVLVHAQWKCYRIKDLTEHQKREASLRCVRDVVRKAQEAYGLVPYSKIQPHFI